MPLRYRPSLPLTFIQTQLGFPDVAECTTFLKETMSATLIADDTKLDCTKALPVQAASWVMEWVLYVLAERWWLGGSFWSPGVIMSISHCSSGSFAVLVISLVPVTAFISLHLSTNLPACHHRPSSLSTCRHFPPLSSRIQWSHPSIFLSGYISSCSSVGSPFQDLFSHVFR